MSSGSAWAACRDGLFASVEDPQQLRLAEWMDQDKRARRRAESGARITAIAAQVASEVSAAVASEVSAAVAAALQAARAGHHGYLDLAPLTPSTPTPPVPDDLTSVPDASMVFSAQQQQQEDAASPQAIDNTVTKILAAWTPTTCSTQSPTRAVTVSVSTPAAVSTLSEVTVGVVTEYCCFDLEPATSTPTSALDILGACSSVINLFALPTSSGVSAVVHTTCSMRCPSCIASEESVLTSSAAPPSFTTAGSVAPEPAAPEFIPMSLRWLFPILNLENWAPTRRSTKECTLVQLEEVMNLTIASVGLPVQHSVELLNDCYIEVWVPFLSAGQLILCVFRLNQWEIAWILEWDGSEHAGVKLEELLFTNMGQEIFQANFVDIYCCGGVTAGCLSFPRLRSTDAYSTEHHMRILGRIMKLLINSVKKYTDATVQEKEAYYAEYNSTLVAMLAIYQMQWKISLLLSYALISEFGIYFALKMVPKNDKLGSEFVQLEIALTVRLASVKSWFPSCFAGCDFRYGREKFQWTIAWSPCSRGYVVYAPTHAIIGSLCYEIQSKENLAERAYGHLIAEAHLAALRFSWLPPQVMLYHNGASDAFYGSDYYTCRATLLVQISGIYHSGLVELKVTKLLAIKPSEDGIMFQPPLYAVITLHKNEKITCILAWLSCDFLSCSSMIARRFCRVMVVSVLKLGIFVPLLSYFTAPIYVLASKYTDFGGSEHVPRKWGLRSWKNAMPIVHQMMLMRYNPFPAGHYFEMGLLHNILLKDWPLIPCFIGYIIGCGFDLLQWKIAWLLDLESSVVRSGGSGNNSFVLTFAHTSHAWVKESHHGSPVDYPAVYKNTSQFSFTVKTYGFHMIDSNQDYYYYACPILDNTYLQIMGDCSAIEMESYTFSRARVSDSYNGCTVQLSSQCALVTRLNQWSTNGEPDSVCLAGVPRVLMLHDLLLTWDPGEKLLDWVQLAGQAPWDPGGSTWSLLEGKPKFKEGGMSAPYYGPASFSSTWPRR